MALHPVLQEKLNITLERPAAVATRRDTVLPAVSNKVYAMIGMRRAGKSTFLLQLHAERLPTQGPERTVY